ncbi:MAG: AlpA family phage regulatory protein [Neisseria sp.]|nr:AlpA family phage regulatory protein [Neisseria sp.]
MEDINIRMLRLRDVMAITGLSRAAIYAKCNPKDKARFDEDFPPRVQLSANAVAWPSDGLQAWLDKRIAASRGSLKNTSKRECND